MLRKVIEQLDPDFEPALDELIDACEAVSDQRTLRMGTRASAAPRTRPRAPRPRPARRLARLCELGLGDPERAIGALRLWTQAAPGEVEPRKRLTALLHERAALSPSCSPSSTRWPRSKTPSQGAQKRCSRPRHWRSIAARRGRRVAQAAAARQHRQPPCRSAALARGGRRRQDRRADRGVRRRTSATTT